MEEKMKNQKMKKKKMMKKIKKMKMMKNVDYISELPDAVLHHILSFLDMIFVVRTSILSKRWRYVWRSVHFLNFNVKVFNTAQFIIGEEEPTSNNHHTINHCHHFMDFVNRTIFLHCKSNINTFSISGVDIRVEYILLRLLKNLKYNPLQKKTRTLDLPLCFFNSNTLTTLKLDMGSKAAGHQVFELPDLSLVGSSVNLPCLKTLHFGSVLLVDGDSIGSFFSRCLVLETLIISNCLLEKRDDLIICGHQLKNLELSISCVKSTCIGDNNGKITVFAPNLISFQCRDLLLSEFYFDLENVSASCLLDADIGGCKTTTPMCLLRFCTAYSSQRMEEYNQNVFKCLRNVCNVKSLSLFLYLLDEDTIGVHSGFQDLLNPFCNLRLLKLITLFATEHILNIAVLEMCPHVETLILERASGAVFLQHDLSHYICVGEVLQPWEMKAPLHCLSYSLKYLEIRGVYGTPDEFRILRFLLKNATVLVKMVIFTYACDEISVERCTEGCIERFREKLVELPKASPNLEISFSNSIE